MPRIFSFPPIAAIDARTLILGSMPGEASLAAGQYYAHPRNAFWRIMAEVLRFDPALPYAGRVLALQAARIALWDVLQSCARTGSLDSAIERDSLVVNDFKSFFREHRGIKRVFFNGATAEKSFNDHFRQSPDLTGIKFTRLPSTSPAHAGKSFAQKVIAWRAIAE
ncbi:MAG: DNA-deoxyinosine glycosylase [Burkholderiales bacterium]|nr:DNA-deoxyinosine glycosylase [Phycisphaerae bacterium]